MPHRRARLYQSSQSCSTPVLAELLDREDAVAGRECLVDSLLQGGRVDVGGGLAAGQGLPCLDGSEVEEVTRLGRWRGRVPGRAPLGGRDLGDVAQVTVQTLGVLPGDSATDSPARSTAVRRGRGTARR